MDVIFYFSIATLAYIYIGYPFALYVLSIFQNDQQHPPNTHQPTISVLIPAYNEQDCIRETLVNKLASNYPEGLLEVIVISDESTDKTDAIVEDIISKDSRVSLIRQSPRQGKTAAINLAVSKAKGDILVFSDANSIYTEDTITELVSAFNDPNVGYVTGNMVYVDSTGSVVGQGSSAYMRYENTIRSLETKVGSVVGVDGGVDAMRKVLYQPLNTDQLPDFVQPLQCVSQGYKVLYRATALLHEESLTDDSSELSMRVRVSLRAFWAMWDMKHLFNPFKYGLFSWQLVSHKLLRYLAIFFMASAFLSNLLLANRHISWLELFLGQCLFYGLAFWGGKARQKAPPLARLAYYFCLINYAAGLAFIKFLQGKKIVTWKPRKG